MLEELWPQLSHKTFYLQFALSARFAGVSGAEIMGAANQWLAEGTTRGSPPLILSGQQRPRGWTAQRLGENALIILKIYILLMGMENRAERDFERPYIGL